MNNDDSIITVIIGNNDLAIISNNIGNNIGNNE